VHAGCGRNGGTGEPKIRTTYGGSSSGPKGPDYVLKVRTTYAFIAYRRTRRSGRRTADFRRD